MTLLTKATYSGEANQREKDNLQVAYRAACESIVLLKNDGTLPLNAASRKVYVEAFKKGLDIGEKNLTMPAKLEILTTDETTSEIQVTIREGKFHQVKRMFQAVGKEVVYLKRMSMGPMRLPEDLKRGEYLELQEHEVNLLRNSVR